MINTAPDIDAHFMPTMCISINKLFGTRVVPMSPPPPAEPPAAAMDHTCKCSICYEHVPAIDSSVLPCGHSFHKGCIDTWVLKSATCPMCRAAVPRMTDPFTVIATQMVANNLLTPTEAHQQVSAITAFLDGNMSYAQMRLLAG